MRYTLWEDDVMRYALCVMRYVLCVMCYVLCVMSFDNASRLFLYPLSVIAIYTLRYLPFVSNTPRLS